MRWRSMVGGWIVRNKRGDRRRGDDEVMKVTIWKRPALDQGPHDQGGVLL